MHRADKTLGLNSPEGREIGQFPRNDFSTEGTILVPRSAQVPASAAVVCRRDPFQPLADSELSRLADHALHKCRDAWDFHLVFAF